MRLKVRFSTGRAEHVRMPATMPLRVRRAGVSPAWHQGERKPLRDVKYAEVLSYRYTCCVRCGRSFRVYPRGVSKGAQQSQRLRAMTVLLYVLGLSYGAV